MKREITVIHDDEKPNKVLIGSPDGIGGPWMDLALLLEGVGVLVAACMNQGITEHNGQPLNEYLKSYIDKVCVDYKTLSVVQQVIINNQENRNGFI